jgi:PAS domain S-box-containing protein
MIATIVENASDVVMLIDLDQRIRFINHVLPLYTREQVEGSSIQNYIPEEHHDAVRQCYARIRESGQPDRYEVTTPMDDGSVAVFEARAAPVFEDGEVAGYAVTASDITERRLMAADRDRFFEMSRDLLCLTRGDGRLLQLNAAFERSLGYGREELLGTSLLDLVHPEERESSAHAFGQLDAQHSAVDFETRMRRKDGSYRWFSWRASPDRKRNAVYAVARDVTERRSLEAQLRQAQRMDAVGKLAGGIAHDFNNLVLAIVGNTDFALKELPDGSTARERLGSVKRAAERAADLTRQLLTFSRQQPINREAVDVNELTANLMMLLERLIPENISLELAAADELPRTYADPGQLEQLIVNLCVNARDAMPDGGNLRIETSLRTLNGSFRDKYPWSRPGRYLRLRVADDGCGMDTKTQEHIFEPFFTTKEAGKGTGLGLATVYGIVRRHEGLIDVDSAPGRGTCIDVYLRAFDGRAPSPSPPASVPAEGGDETVLVAEDEPMVRELVVQILEEAGYAVLTASNGQEAVQLLEDPNMLVDLVLLDMVMPKLDGPKTLTRLRATRPHLPAVFTSGYSEAPQGAHERVPVVAKPYEPDELLQAVRRALDRAARKPDQGS